MNDFFNAFFLVYAGLFPIVNPIGGAPLFLRLTRGSTEPERNAAALAVARNSFLLLLGSLFVGSHVLVFFGITLPVVRIAGGVVVAAFAWQLLHSGTDADGQQDAVAARKSGLPVDAFYPLTMPLTVGPGSISVAITLGSQRPYGADMGDLAMLGIAAVAGLAAIAATIYVCYRFAEDIVALLGERGTSVLMRLSAFILFCIGIQIVWNGWQALNATASP